MTSAVAGGGRGCPQKQDERNEVATKWEGVQKSQKFSVITYGSLLFLRGCNILACEWSFLLLLIRFREEEDDDDDGGGVE